MGSVSGNKEVIRMVEGVTCILNNFELLSSLINFSELLIYEGIIGPLNYIIIIPCIFIKMEMVTRSM